MRDTKTTIKRFVPVLLFLLLLTFLFPYTGDDWTWGSKVGLELLGKWFDNYNGRYVGNIIVILLTRSRILRTIVMTSTIFGILYLSFKIVNKEKPELFFVGLALFLAMHKFVFRQAIVWTSGFTNYTISIFLTLIYIYINKDLITKNKSNKSFLYCLLITIFGFISALFIENITIYNTALALLIIIYSYKKYKKVSNIDISYLIGSVAGIILMFSNSVYSNIASNLDTYRTMPNSIIGGIKQAFNNYFSVIYSEMIFNNFFLNVIITTLLIYLTYKFMNNKDNNQKQKDIILVSIIINVAYIFYLLIILINHNWLILLNYTIYFEGLFTALYFLSIIVITFITIKDKSKKGKLIFYLFSIILMMLPLLFVTPVGSRCFLATYVMFIIYILELINYLINDKIIKYISQVAVICIIMFGIYLINIYLYIFSVDYKRLQNIKEMSKIDDNVIVTTLPYNDYVWMATPVPKYSLDNRYKLFYNIDESINFYYMTFEEWKLINN